MKFVRILVNAAEGLKRWFRGEHSFSLFITYFLLDIRILRMLSIYPRIVKMREGLKVYVDNLATLYVNVPDQYIRKEYELHPEYVPRKAWKIIDIGSYVGLYTCRAAKLVSPLGLVIAFEPNPSAYYWLIKNISLNKITNVKAYPIALGDRNGDMDFFVVTKGNVGMSSSVSNHIENMKKWAEEVVRIKVPVYTLNHFLPGLGLEHLDLVKIDVEGAELKVLEGSSSILERGLIRRLVVEIHTDIVQRNEVIQFLRNYGYRLDLLHTFNGVKDIGYFCLSK